MLSTEPKNLADMLPEGMTQIFIGLFMKGLIWTAESTPEIQQHQREHLDLLMKLRDRGVLLLSGPTPDGSDLRGILICRGESVEAVQGLFADDAHVNSGRLILEFHPWFVATEALHKALIPLEM